MDWAESDRPAKKRRFFVEQPEDPIALQPTFSPPPKEHATSAHETIAPAVGFDQNLLESVIGEKLSDDVVAKIRHRAGDNVEQAVNVYFDGSWRQTNTNAPRQTPIRSVANGISTSSASTPRQQRSSPPTSTSSTPPKCQSMPARRYIGSFGVVGWATRSGTGLIGHEEKIRIERQRTQNPKVGRGGKVIMNKKQDNVVRFVNSKSQEVGRLENDSAAWIAPLLDQSVFEIDASCVFAPERIRTNDTIYLQMHAYLKKDPFEMRGLIKPSEDNRTTGIFEAKETQAERDLHLRQISLVKLFDEINLQPSKTNATTEKHKRQGLLKAADMAEQYDQREAAKPDGAAEKGNSSDEEEEGETLEQDQLDSLYKKAQSFDFNTPEMEPASTFNMSLRKYQRQALHWMVGKEKDVKTNPREVSMHPLWEEYKWPVKDADDKDVPQVEGQDNFYVNPYSGEVSLEFPVQEQNCLGGILADEMGLGKTIEMMSLIHTHRNVPPDAEETTVNNLPRLPSTTQAVVDAPYTTLVVAPMSLLSQWQSEAEKASTEGSLKTLLYYGSDNRANLQALCCEANAANAPNVIITSYGIVLSEFTSIAGNGGNRGAYGGLFSLNYFRVILDEAHSIKNRQAKTSKACYELAAMHRWVLTGTPIVNRLEDLFSLVHFLRVEPWSNFSFWKTFITVPFESGEYVKALDVVQTVLEPLVLRRTKDMKTPDGEALVPLPPRQIDVESIELSKNEKEIYSLIFARAKRTFSANVEAGTLMKSYTTIFAQILRLRQSCCHPVLTRNKDILREEIEAEAAADEVNGLADDMDLQNLIARFSAESAEQDANAFGAHALKEIQTSANGECPLCFEEPMIEQSVTGCWHSACKKCLSDYIQHQIDKGEIPRCFNCREPISARDTFEVVRHDDTSDGITLRRLNQPSSAKITALLTHLKRLRNADPAAKSVVFSQFTSFLDLIEPSLARANIPFLRFDGSMPQKTRAAVIAAFTAPTPASHGTVLLLSLRAGGVGLNLTAAQNVFMMDPWWSWAVEAQAIDRVHRMGQDKPVRVVRFVCTQSIEEKMLRIQERKKFLASSLGMMGEEERRRERVEDIRELLS